jgi:5-methylcytosine-specific restriction enzyme B
MPYMTRTTLITALGRLKGTADHLIKIWFTLKQMGMTAGHPVRVTTSSPDDALVRLFGCGFPDGSFYIPFAHTERYMTMKSHASRSIVQTTLKRWEDSGSVVTVDPTSYLDIVQTEAGPLEVKPGRSYPQGLGHGRYGFALDDDIRVSIPFLSFAVWYYRQHNLQDESSSVAALKQSLERDLWLSPAEMELVFVQDRPPWSIELQDIPLSDQELFAIVQESLRQGTTKKEYLVHQSFAEHTLKVRSMTTIAQGPRWLKIDPERQFQGLVEAGSKAILLYGPPRTGKTRAVDQLISRESQDRETIQIHHGWGYSELVLGLSPKATGSWKYQKGPLLAAIEAGKTYVVLEEINRTEFSQAIGEVFSLIELAYRGEENRIRLRNGDDFHIPRDTLIICTMNTLDRSTEEIDDALFGRMDAVEFPPRVESLYSMLQEQGVEEPTAEKLRELFSTIQQYYPLGHGYFAPFSPKSDPITFYLTRLRPVLQKHLQDYRDHELAAIDEKVDQLLG